jgi:hypothetical protein
VAIAIREAEGESAIVEDDAGAMASALIYYGDGA